MMSRNAREEVAYGALIFAVDALKGMGASEELPVMKDLRNALALFEQPAPVTPIERGFVDAAPLTFRDFQAKNAARIPAFGMTLTHRTLMEWCCELAEETGEVCGVAKKRARTPHPTIPGHDIAGKKTPTLHDLADELGDVVTVAACVASRAGIDLELAVRQKWNNVSSRVSHPERI